MARARIRVVWVPVWEGKIRNWTAGFIKKNKWRCDHIFDVEDLLQDAYLTFTKIRDTYPRVIDPPHFMALYKRAMFNFLHDHARTRQQKGNAIYDPGFDAGQFYADRIMGEVTNAGYARMLLAEAPEELQMALRLVQDPEAEGPARYEGTDTWVRRSLGFDKRLLKCHRNFTFTKALKTYLLA